MRRRLLYLCLLLSALGAFAAVAVVLALSSGCEDFLRSEELVTEAQQLGAAGRRQEAFAAVQTAVAIAPDNPRAHRELAMHFIARGKTDEALEELQAASKAAPRDAGLASEVALTMDALGDKKGALRWFRRAADIDPKDGLILGLLAGSLLNAGETEEALAVGDRAVKLAPRMQPAQFNLGLARWRSGDRSGALEAFREAIRLRPSDVSAMLCAAGVSGELERWEEALRYTRRAVEIAPDNPNAWVGLGGALVRTGDRRGAREAFSRAFQLDSGNAAARKALFGSQRQAK